MEAEKYIIEAHNQAIASGFYDCPECGEVQQPPCSHPGCFSHVTHPCEGCGRTEGRCKTCNGTGINPNRDIGEMLMLIVTELGEAVEAHREKKTVENLYKQFPGYLDNYSGGFLKEFIKDCDTRSRDSSGIFEKHFKDTLEDEIADAFIRFFDLCGYLKIEKIEKMEPFFNFYTENLAGQILRIVGLVQDLQDHREWNDFAILYYTLIQFCFIHNIDIELYIAAKMAYNKTRPRKHGKEY